MMLEEAWQVIGDRDGHDRLQQFFLDAGRFTVLGSWLVVIYSFGNPGANAVHTLLGFALLLLGVFLLTFSPVAFRCLQAARVSAAVENA